MQRHENGDRVGISAQCLLDASNTLACEPDLKLALNSSYVCDCSCMPVDPLGSMQLAIQTRIMQSFTCSRDVAPLALCAVTLH